MNDEFGKKNNKIKRGYKRRMGESCVFFILHEQKYYYNFWWRTKEIRGRIE